MTSLIRFFDADKPFFFLYHSCIPEDCYSILTFVQKNSSGFTDSLSETDFQSHIVTLGGIFRSLFNCMSSSISACRLHDDLTRLLRQAYVQADNIGKDDDCQDWWNQFNYISHVGDVLFLVANVWFPRVESNYTFVEKSMGVSKLSCICLLPFLIFHCMHDDLLFYHDGQHNFALMTTACDRALSDILPLPAAIDEPCVFLGYNIANWCQSLDLEPVRNTLGTY